MEAAKKATVELQQGRRGYVASMEAYIKCISC